MENLQASMSDMTSLFNARMAEFQADLQKANVTPTTTSLSTDFNTFKTFITAALSNLQRLVEIVAQQLDNLEMRGRRKILLLHGISEEKDEDTQAQVVDIVSTKLKITNFTASSIGRCHRMGRSSNDKPRPILVKFTDIEVRDKIWFAKSGLKETGITLSEFLTKCRHDAFMAARKYFGVTKCWTSGGFIIIATPEGEKKRVYNLADVNQLIEAASIITAEPAVAVASNSGVSKNAPARSKRVNKK